MATTRPTIPTKLESNLLLANGDRGTSVSEAFNFKFDEIENLYRWEESSKQFELNFQERGKAYNEAETTLQTAQLTLTNLSDSSNFSLTYCDTPTQKWGINFAGVVRVSHSVGVSTTERLIYIPGTRTYDPAGITGDPHASERIGPSCSRTQSAITISQLVSVLHGATSEQLQQIQESLRPLIVRYHGRVPLFDWMLLQIKEAIFDNKDVTPYPEYLNSLVSSNKLDLATANREHTRAYLQSYNAGDPKPPVQYYKKVAAKDKVEEILEGEDLDVFKTLIQ